MKMCTSEHVTVLDEFTDVFLCYYACGLYTVDRCNKSVGMTIKASFNGDEAKSFFDELKLRSENIC